MTDNRVALPDPILPPSLAYQLGLDARPEGHFVEDFERNIPYLSEPLSLSDRHPRHEPMPTLVRDAFRKV